MFKVTFSDGRSISVSASTEADARNKACRIERAYAVVTVAAL